jgi:hypothetical protein
MSKYKWYQNKSSVSQYGKIPRIDGASTGENRLIYDVFRFRIKKLHEENYPKGLELVYENKDKLIELCTESLELMSEDGWIIEGKVTEKAEEQILVTFKDKEWRGEYKMNLQYE